MTAVNKLLPLMVVCLFFLFFTVYSLQLKKKMAEYEFESGESQASATYPAQASSLRKGGHILIRNRPCKIVEMSRSQPGKHGHAKVSVFILNLI